MAITLPVYNRKPAVLNVEEVRVVNAVSPKVTMTEASEGVQLNILDAFGNHTVMIYNGQTGATGPAGRSITGVMLNGNYTLTLTFSDGTTYTTASIRGATGAKGDTGPKGDPGLDYVLTEADKETIAGIAEGHFTEPVTAMYNDMLLMSDQVSDLASQVDSDKTATTAARNEAVEAVGHYPEIRDNYWWVWDTTEGKYVNTGYKAKGDTGETGSEHTVIIQEQQPTQAANKLWVPLGEDQEVEIPTMDDFDSLPKHIYVQQTALGGMGNTIRIYICDVDEIPVLKAGDFVYVKFSETYTYATNSTHNISFRITGESGMGEGHGIGNIGTHESGITLFKQNSVYQFVFNGVNFDIVNFYPD